MQTLRFPDARRLRHALETGAVPAAVYRAPAAGATDQAGRVWLTTNAFLSKKSLLALGKLGVEVGETDRVPAALPLSCWHEALPLVAGLLTPDGPHLLDLPISQLVTVGSELDRVQAAWSFRWHDGDRVLVRANPIPYHLMLRWGETAAIAGFMQRGDGVWVTWGREHPLAARVTLPKGKWVLIAAEGWRWIDADPWADPVRSFPVAPAETTAPAANRLDPITVPLRLLPVREHGGAELWIVREQALAGLEKFAREADSVMVSRFSVALARTEQGPLLALRTAAGREFVPPFAATACKPLGKLPNLFVPQDRRLSPLPRRDVLRRVLAPDAKRLHWLRPLEDATFRVESLPLNAFRPLAEWIAYRVEQPSRPHNAWRVEELFFVEPFIEMADAVLRPPRPAVVPPTVPENGLAVPKRSAGRGWFTRQLDWLTGAVKRRDTPSAEPQAAESQTDEPLPSRAVDPPAKLSEAAQYVKRLEAEFIHKLGGLTAEDRRQMWPELATAYARANKAGEAAICWLGALWDEPAPSPTSALGWLKAEAASAKWNPNAGTILDWAAAPATPARVRAVAAWAVWAATQEKQRGELTQHLARIRTYLEKHEDELPVRAMWLAHSTLARLSRGDLLALARARDRLFDRLYLSGLSADRDLPAFIRFAESGDPGRFNSVRQWLAEKRGLVRRWIAQLKPQTDDGQGEQSSLEEYGLEPEVPGTQAYADLMIAWGLARLGDRNESARMRDQAMARLDDSDPVHAALKRMFDERIRQVREGRPAASSTVIDLDSISVDDRYRVDRLRQHSRILDPAERVNAYWTSHFRNFRQWGPLRRQLVELPMLESDALQQRVRELLAQVQSEANALPLVLAPVLETVPYLEPELADRVLDLLPSGLEATGNRPEVHARLLERGMLAAATVERPVVVQGLTRRFLDFIDSRQARRLPPLLEGLASQTFRCLRRLGLKAEADQVLSQVYSRLTGGQDFATLRQRLGADWPALLRTLLHVAAGWYYSGRDVEGHKIIDDARWDLYQGAIPLKQRTGLALAYASTLGQIPVRLALSRFEEMFQRLKKVSVNGWNTHYTLQPLQLIDTMVLATVSEDFTLGPAIRGWLDDEEYLVRQRIQGELKDLMARQGMG